MLGFLFGRLTAAPARGTALFDRVTAIAREPHWYLEGQVPDTLDGRFAILSTITALVLARLEPDGEAGTALAVALTERFIAVMDSEHRQLGLGDPTLGKTVRRLVGALARRTDLWRSARSSSEAWEATTRECLYKGDVPRSALHHSAAALEKFRERLDGLSVEELEKGMVEG
jgi:cytochrome b pre-mRNA-processing protein 3